MNVGVTKDYKLRDLYISIKEEGSTREEVKKVFLKKTSTRHPESHLGSEKVK
jgi:hypothetical protein